MFGNYEWVFISSKHFVHRDVTLVFYYEGENPYAITVNNLCRIFMNNKLHKVFTATDTVTYIIQRPQSYCGDRLKPMRFTHLNYILIYLIKVLL